MRATKDNIQSWSQAKTLMVGETGWGEAVGGRAGQRKVMKGRLSRRRQISAQFAKGLEGTTAGMEGSFVGSAALANCFESIRRRWDDV